MVVYLLEFVLCMPLTCVFCCGGFFVLVSFGGLGIFTEQVFNNACSPPVLAKS